MGLFPNLKMGKREALARTLAMTRLFDVTKMLNSDRLTVFNYHRIARGDPAHEPFDSAVFGPDEETFRSQLRNMKLHAEVLSEDDLIDSIARGRKLPRRCFMVTFDDGYRDNFERALPILRELRIPGIFFIPTQTIEERRLGWWDHVSWFLKQSTKDSITFRGRRYALQGAIPEVAEVLLQMIKLESASDTATLLAELSEACGVSEPSRELCDREMMSWDQIREAMSQGITIGSHTHTHRVLATLDLATQREEIFGSRKLLEERLGKRVRSMSYPVGGYEHFNVETKALVREAGYELAFSFNTGVNGIHAVDAYDVKRICPESNAAMFTGIFCLPQIYAPLTCAMNAPAPHAAK